MNTDQHRSEKPILFSGEMVRAILDGRKTQTRRVVKSVTIRTLEAARQAGEVEYPPENSGDQKYIAQFCPYGQPGDRLWVKETWAIARGAVEYSKKEKWQHQGWPLWYRADNSRRFTGSTDGGSAFMEREKKWRPSIFMPRWASRITLEIESVRVERLQDISEEDAKAEACGWLGSWVNGYRILWESINGPCSWDANPWVWVITFKR